MTSDPFLNSQDDPCPIAVGRLLGFKASHGGKQKFLFSQVGHINTKTFKNIRAAGQLVEYWLKEGRGTQAVILQVETGELYP